MANPQTAATDPLLVDSKHYKLELETDTVRVLRTTYGPREKSVMHSHPAVVVVVIKGGHARFTLPDGKTEEIELQAGQVINMAATQHLPENVGDSTFEAVLVELKS